MYQASSAIYKISCVHKCGSCVKFDSYLTLSWLSAGDPLKALDEAVWLLATMMDGGARYAKINGLETAPPLTADELLDVMDLNDFGQLRTKITEAVVSGRETHVEADPGKNAETTPAAP